MTAALCQPTATQYVAIGEAAHDAPAAPTFAVHLDASQHLHLTLRRAGFDPTQVTHVSWLGAPCASVADTLAALAYIAALPEGSTLVFDYAAMQALASRVALPGERGCVFVQPRALHLLLESAGFRHIEEHSGIVHASN